MIFQILSNLILSHIIVQAQLKLLPLLFQQHQLCQHNIIFNALELKVVHKRVIISQLLLPVELHQSEFQHLEPLYHLILSTLDICNL
jgi:hypothetical protein